jgi:hypothetical protein
MACLLDCLLDSRALMWLVPGGGLRCGHRPASLRLVAKLPHVGADADRLAYRLHRPTSRGRQAMAQSFLTSPVLSHRPVKARVSSSCLSGMWSPLRVVALPWRRPTFTWSLSFF